MTNTEKERELRRAKVRTIRERESESLRKMSEAEVSRTVGKPGQFWCRQCGAWLYEGGTVHDEGEHEGREE